MKVALLGTLAVEQHKRLQGRITVPAQFIALPDPTPVDAVAAGLVDAQAIVTMRYDRTMPPAPKLGLVHVGGAGWDDIDLEYLRPGVTVCNAYGHEVSVAEFVITAMLVWCTRFCELDASFRAGSWRMSGRHGADFREELCGKTVGVLGYGHIGRELARRAAAMGTRVIVSTRTLEPLPSGVAWLGGPERLPDLLAESDFVAICCSLTEETRGLFDARRLGLMKRSGVLINVSRGAIVDEDALFDALQRRIIGGAVIDAWYHYPSRENMNAPPSRHPFHDLPNLIMTPHASAWTLGMIERRWAVIADNLDRFAGGRPLLNVVHRT